jgi:tetratricopeptide (TPR) repeat protein
VRELANVMERVALLGEGAVITGAMLGLPLAVTTQDVPDAAAGGASDGNYEARTERARLLDALGQNDWNVSRTALRLGLTRNILRYRMRKLGVERKPASGPVPELYSAPLAISEARLPGDAGSAPARTGIRWERRHVTFLRADFLPRDPAAPDTTQTLDLLVEKVQGFGGQIEELSPTVVVAAFGLDAIEDAPRRAVRTALAILKATERVRQEEAGYANVTIALHVGHLPLARGGGRVAVDRDALREACTVLERLLERARPGTILVSQAALPFLERRFDVQLVSPQGPGAQPAYRLASGERAGLGLGSRLTEFVGRQRELEVLARCYGEARGGAVRAVTVSGQAGIGKSRLVHEWTQRLAGDRVAVLQAHCTADGRGTPFLPFIQVVRSAFLIEEGDGAAAIDGKLRRGVEHLGLPAEATLPFLRLLLGLEGAEVGLQGLDPQLLGARTREALARVLRARCQLTPAVLILDDIHWADTASQELLRRLVETDEPASLLIVATARPPYRAPWAGCRAVTELRIEPLTEDSCHRLVQHCAGSEALPDELVRLVVGRAEGNPLFAEELTRFLVERKDLALTAEGTSSAPGPESLPLPGTLQHLVLARVDQLTEGARALLRVSSVVGRRFPLDLVRAISGPDVDLSASVQEVEAHELVVRDGVEHHGEEYRFKHALIQDAIYESLPAPQREALHERAAEAIERLYEGRPGEWTELLAHHYSRTSLPGKAVRYLVDAAQKSLRVYSLEEADRRFRQVLELLEPETRRAEEILFTDALLGLAQIRHYRGDHEGLIGLVERYRARVEAVGDVRRLSRLLFWAGFAHVHGARFDLARRLFDEALALGEAAGDEPSIGYASLGLLNAYFLAWGDRSRDAVDRLGDRALDIAERIGDVYLLSQCLDCLCMHKKTSGQYGQARDLARRLLELGRKAGAPELVAQGVRDLGWVDLYDERYEEALERANEAMRIATGPLDRLLARTIKANAFAFVGPAGEAIETLGEVRRELHVLQMCVDVPYGVALVRAGRVADGVRWLEQCIPRFTRWGNRYVVARGHVVLGEVYLGMVRREATTPWRPGLRNLAFALRNRPVAARKARHHFEEGVRIAREVGIPPILARGLIGLGVLHVVQRRRDEAHACFDEARQVAEPIGSPSLLERIRAALELRPSERPTAQRVA